MFGLTPFDYGIRSFAAYDPFKEMEELEKRFFGRQLPAIPTIRSDIREVENAYILEAELPGFAKEDIHAEIKDGYLTIRAEKKSSNEEKDEKNNYVTRERSYGSFARTFDLSGINAEEITAAYKDGILSVTLPKAAPEADKGRRIEIE